MEQCGTDGGRDAADHGRAGSCYFLERDDCCYLARPRPKPVTKLRNEGSINPQLEQDAREYREGKPERKKRERERVAAFSTN